MAEFIRRSERITRVSYDRYFESTEFPGSGFSFRCDESGTVDTDALAGPMRDNYWRCIVGIEDVVDRGVRRSENTYTEPAAIRCRCGAEVVLYSSWASECEKCGTEYNGGGQALAPRSQWGEETGESVADMESGYDPEEIRPVRWELGSDGQRWEVEDDY